MIIILKFKYNKVQEKKLKANRIKILNMSDRLREIVNMRNFHENSLHTTGEILNRYGYKLGRTIGYGSYCKVRIALKMTEDRKRVACKSIDKRKASSDYVGKFLPREINILKSIEHPNIVSIHDIFLINDQVHIFMDLCEKGDLLEYICCKGPIPENKAKHFFRQLVSALEYLHNMEISHRDIKCENILLSSGNVLKITDFGFARLCRDKKGNRILSDTFCGSTAYAAPEILQGMSYNPKMYDMWSLGCVLYIMLAASMPFDDSNIRNMLKTMINKNITFPPHCDGTLSPAAVHLVWHLLEPDITKRATIRQVAGASWLQEDVRSSDRSSRQFGRVNGGGGDIGSTTLLFDPAI